jgi:hypothetical protein
MEHMTDNKITLKDLLLDLSRTRKRKEALEKELLIATNQFELKLQFLEENFIEDLVDIGLQFEKMKTMEPSSKKVGEYDN